MKIGLGLSSRPVSDLLTASGCTGIRVESEKRASMVTFLDAWRGKPVKEFLKAKDWLPTAEFAGKRGFGRTLAINALSAQSGGGAGGSLTYHQVDTWTNGVPSITSTGANQPLGMVPPIPP